LVKDKTIISKAAERLEKMIKTAPANLEKLSVLPVQFSGGVNEQEGDALAQLLAIHLLRAGKYAIYPRTKTLEQVKSEYDTQLSGVTSDTEAVAIGQADNPPYVLSVASRKIGSSNGFNGSIIKIETNAQIEGGSEDYTTLRDGMTAMEFLAKTLSGVPVSKAERDKRTASLGSTASAEEKAQEKERRREEAARKKGNRSIVRRESPLYNFRLGCDLGGGPFFGGSGFAALNTYAGWSGVSVNAGITVMPTSEESVFAFTVGLNYDLLITKKTAWTLGAGANFITLTAPVTSTEEKTDSQTDESELGTGFFVKAQVDWMFLGFMGLRASYIGDFIPNDAANALLDTKAVPLGSFKYLDRVFVGLVFELVKLIKTK